MRIQPFSPRSLAVLVVLATAVPAAFVQDVLAQEGVARDASARDAEERERSLQAQIAALRLEVDVARHALVKPITVNGVELDPRRVLRSVVFLLGGQLVEAKVVEFFIQEQMEVSIAAGRDPAELEISDEEILSTLRDAEAKFAQTSPGIDFWEVLRAQTGMDKESMVHQQRQGMLFQRVFFPGTPSQWPLITREAIIASTGGQSGRDYLDQLEKTMRDEDGNVKELPAFWTQMSRTWIEKQLRKWSDIRYPSDGLPDDQVLSVNGRTWSAEDAFEVVRPGVYAQDMERALAEVVIREALRQELVKSGHYMDDEEYSKRWDVYREPFDSTPFDTRLIAVTFKGYPCLEAFRQRWRLIKSFQDMIAEDITDENLLAHGERFKALFSDGRISFDVIPFSGRDPATRAWRPNGMEEARKRAEAAFQLLEKDEITFEDLKEQRGEFPPNNEDRGELAYKPINQVRKRLGESEFTDLLLGYGVGNYLVYEAELGQAVGPLLGPEAYFIARVNIRTPPYRAIDIEDKNKRELIVQDYVNWRFLQWANEVLARADIK